MPPLRCSNASASSSARLFVQLCHNTTASRTRTAIPASSVLDDILLPPSTRAFHSGRRISEKSNSIYHVSRRANAASTPFNPSATPSSWSLRRHLSSTAARRATTQAIYNPQDDEDGNPMVLEITQRAANRLSQIMKKDENPHLALRIQVESGGCHGYQYLMSLMTLPSSPSSSSSPAPENPAPEAAAADSPSTTPTPSETSSSALQQLSEEDTIFAFYPEDSGAPPAAAADTSAGAGEGLPKIVLDGPSLELLKGSKLDFTMELIGSQFKIVDNPYASSSCGCGTSFDIKF